MGLPASAFVLMALVAHAGGKPFKAPEALEAWMAGYHAHPEPLRLSGALKDAMALGMLGRPEVLGFFVTAYRGNPEAEAALIAGFPREDLSGHMAGLVLLGSLGEDLTDHLILLPDDMRGRFGKIPVLADPTRPLALAPVPDPQEVQRALDRMNHALGAYRATGDLTYLRVILTGLRDAADHPAFLAWAAPETRDPNPGPAVARGCVYDQARATLLRLRGDALATTTLRALAREATEPAWLRQELLQMEPAPTRP